MVHIRESASLVSVPSKFHVPAATKNSRGVRDVCSFILFLVSLRVCTVFTINNISELDREVHGRQLLHLES